MCTAPDCNIPCQILWVGVPIIARFSCFYSLFVKDRSRLRDLIRLPPRSDPAGIPEPWHLLCFSCSLPTCISKPLICKSALCQQQYHLCSTLHRILCMTFSCLSNLQLVLKGILEIMCCCCRLLTLSYCRIFLPFSYDDVCTVDIWSRTRTMQNILKGNDQVLLFLNFCVSELVDLSYK